MPPPPPAPGWPAAAWQTVRPPQHPRAVWALVLGIVGLAGGFILLAPLLASPLAWALGARALRDAEREPDRWSPGPAKAGLVMGAVGTVLLAVTALVLLGSGLIVLALATGSNPYGV